MYEPWEPLPLDSALSDYDAQASTLLDAWRAGSPDAVRHFHDKLPRFLRDDVPWVPRPLTDADILAAPLGLDDARLAVARSYDFADWEALTTLVEAVQDAASPVARFEWAVDALISGDMTSLSRALDHEPALVAARSTRRTHFDPPVHGAMLLHYVAANGVEGYRQRTPPNIEDVARLLLERGADANATASLYGGACTTMSLLVSSAHPAQAGVQVPLVDLLVDFGASVEATGTGGWTSPLRTALTFGYVDAARALVRRGARVATVVEAAGLGDLAAMTRLLPEATADDRHRALALAAALGRGEVLVSLLDAGEDPDRYNPPHGHAHSTPLHQAVAAGRLEVVQVLVGRGARLDMRDTTYDATPLGWAEYLGQTAIAEFLREKGAGR